MEVSYQFRGIFQVRHSEPRILLYCTFVTGPTYIVKQKIPSMLIKFRVEYFCNFEFNGAVQFNQGWGWVGTVGDLAGWYWF